MEEIKYRYNNLVKNDYWQTYLGLIKRQIISYYSVNPEIACKYQEEIKHLKESNDLVFPYPIIKILGNVESGFDNSLCMPYVVHKDKKLYFPSNMSAEFAVKLYKNFIETECILGGGYRSKAPHQYESESVYVSEGDILLDIGCAEALFALDHIEKVKKVYLVESDSYWADALKATFKPYASKVVFVNKLISDSNSDASTTLSSLLKDEVNESIFIKMDIEGYEQMVLKSSLDFFQAANNVKIACCTYHRGNDFEEISLLLKNNGFQTEASDGYMIFPQGEVNSPFFRKGVIRANRQK